MSIEEVLSEERKVLNSEIEELEKKVKNWIIGIMQDVEFDRKNNPDLIDCSFEQDVADNMLMTIKDFEFAQLDVLKELSDKLEQRYNNYLDDERFGRKIA